MSRRSEPLRISFTLSPETVRTLFDFIESACGTDVESLKAKQRKRSSEKAIFGQDDGCTDRHQLDGIKGAGFRVVATFNQNNRQSTTRRTYATANSYRTCGYVESGGASCVGRSWMPRLQNLELCIDNWRQLGSRPDYLNPSFDIVEAVKQVANATQLSLIIVDHRNP